ncbi:hypothetical protein PISL3812_00288 [Talaromyces islandicus]|uniref:Vacuolar ATPase assembly protein VMA22 n=1 Tax=Talaromyces islandicus TaxID=28573 RepID=A0A0U1LLG1_TALIS|nr:hypothetical protein PISL3812_00288 [Talaromyces islandicus]
MAQVPTPPLSRETSVEPVKVAKYVANDQVQELDNLLERYLYLIDNYQTLQKKLGKNLSSGFFSLTHANYCSPTRRFGEDFYDERMKATRRLNITTHESQDLQAEAKQPLGRKIEVNVEYRSVLAKDGDTNSVQESDKTTLESEKANREHEPPESVNESQDPGTTTPPPTSSENEETHKSLVEETKPSKTKRFRSDDPISWYGILVPPSLRSAQTSFTESVNSDIPQLVSTINEIKQIESLIYRLRKDIETA